MSTKSKKSPKKGIIFGVIVLILAGTGMYIFSSSSTEGTDNAQIDSDILSVRASVTAFIQDIRFKDNQEVKMGDTLIIFETTELRARVAQANAALQNAEAAFKSATNRASAGQNNIEAAFLNTQAIEEGLIAAQANLNKAQKSYDRIIHLLEVKAATLEQKESAEAALAMANADVARIQKQQKSSESSKNGLNAISLADKDAIESSAATVKQREAELALAQEQLNHAYVISPFNGVVSKRAVQKGQFVNVGQSLCTVVQMDELWVSANFKETQISHIQPGQEVEIRVDALKGKVFKGKVSSFSGATGSKFALIPPDNATGNFIKVTQRFPIRIAFDSISSEERKLLFPGLSAVVTVKVK